MYAQLCKRLCDEAPRFEANKEEPCTFKILLLASCRMQFVSRPKNERDKRKSLGNIKFIGELCKLAVVNECILHKLLLLLLKRCDIDEQSENLECLCQILRTCGRILDHEKGKNLMDQYFERMESLMENPELPSRIRFMIQDSIELRANKWVPRKGAKVEGPLPIAQVGGGGSEPARERPPPQQELFPRLKPRTGFDAMLATNNGINFGQDKYSPSYTSNGFSSGRNQSLKTTTPSLLYPQPPMGNNHYNSGGRYSRETNGKDTTRNVKRISHGQLTTNPEEVSLRPPSNSIIAKSYTMPTNNNHQNSNNSLYKNSNSTLLNDTKPSPPIQTTKEVPLVIKPTAPEKAKPSKKDKATTKEETMKKVNSIAEEVMSGGKIDEAVTTFSQLKIQDKLITECIVQLISCTFEKEDSDTEKMMELVGSLRSDSCVVSERLAEAARDVVRATTDTPRGALVAALTVRHRLISLDVFSELTEPHYPLLFDALAKLHAVIGKEELSKIFSESKVRLMHCLPDGQMRKEALRAVLEERGLVYLEPVLGLEAELWAALERDPSPQSFYRQAKECLAQAGPGPHFITAIVTVVIRFVNQEVGNEEGDSKVIQEKEKIVLERFKKILQAFLQESVALQVEAVYALQMFFYHLDFPKGCLVRWFIHFYNLEVVEEEAFLKWREDDVTDQYPGKGEALFQVNHWLNWLSTAEEEDEEEEAD